MDEIGRILEIERRYLAEFDRLKRDFDALLQETVSVLEEMKIKELREQVNK